MIDASEWHEPGEWDDIQYATTDDGIAKITINRPEVHNTSRLQTLVEVDRAITKAREDEPIGIMVHTGAGDRAFCSGGDQRVRGDSGYKLDDKATGRFPVTTCTSPCGRCPNPIVAMVAGCAIGGGHVLRPVCDPTITADNAVFGQVGPKVGSFDAATGPASSPISWVPRRPREFWFISVSPTRTRRSTWGWSTPWFPSRGRGRDPEVVPRDARPLTLCAAPVQAQLPLPRRRHAGIQQLAHETNLLFYGSAEAQEGREAFKARRQPDITQFPRRP
jgi:naphthoate synthase